MTGQYIASLMLWTLSSSAPLHATGELGKSIYSKQIGYYLEADTFLILAKAAAIQCFWQCKSNIKCRHMNVYKNGTSTAFYCEFIDTFIDVKHSTIKAMQNSTLYSKAYPGMALLQRRYDGSVDFQQNWDSYKRGFGHRGGEFWLGLDKANYLMQGRDATLRFDMWDGEEHAFMEYYKATISNEADNYTLSINGMSGNAGDSMMKRMMFTTKDRDNDLRDGKNCAIKVGGYGGWWYRNCKSSNLNGIYGSNTVHGVTWYSFKGEFHSLSRTEISIIMKD